jgi:hypothetical protein
MGAAWGEFLLSSLKFEVALLAQWQVRHSNTSLKKESSMTTSFVRTMPVVLALALASIGVSAVAQTAAPATAEPTTPRR